LFAGSIGRTDFPGSSNIQMQYSLRKLIILSSSYLVRPGHGGETTMEIEKRDNPFLFDL
jgi:hydroxyacylglutathione hydrolase